MKMIEKPKINYDKVMQDIIKEIKDKPKILLHSCCGPCSTEVIERLKDYFDITVIYYNPNIEPLSEYEKRKSEQIRYIKESNLNVKFLDCDYENIEFKKIAKNLENELEGGARCHKCYYLRMFKTAKKAKELNFSYFATTLTVSPYKDSQVINEIGRNIERELNIKFLFSDFKKKDGYKKSVELSKKYNLYRQDYCGCLYGKKLFYE